MTRNEFIATTAARLLAGYCPSRGRNSDERAIEDAALIARRLAEQLESQDTALRAALRNADPR